MILLPDADGAISGHWVAVGETNRWECLDDDNDGTSYVKTASPGRTMVIRFANPSVSEADIDFDEDVGVQFLSSGRSMDRANPSLVDIAFHLPRAGFSETATYASSLSYTTQNGTVRITEPGGTDWTYSNLEDLEMKCTKNGGYEVRLSYLALEVTYTATTAAADNAVFFGTNF